MRKLVLALTLAAALSTECHSQSCGGGCKRTQSQSFVISGTALPCAASGESGQNQGAHDSPTECDLKCLALIEGDGDWRRGSPVPVIPAFSKSTHNTSVRVAVQIHEKACAKQKTPYRTMPHESALRSALRREAFAYSRPYGAGCA